MALFSDKRSLHVSGTVKFSPRKNGVYDVKGRLREGSCSVWIANSAGAAVSKRITKAC